VDISGAELREQFDAICLAVGASRPRDLDVPGRELEGIHHAADFLRRFNAPQGGAVDVRDKAVAVVGGGETGNDCVEAALRQGARSVVQLEILPEAAVGGAPTHGNVRRHCATLTKAFRGANGHLDALEAVRVRWTRSDRGPVMSEVPGSERRFRAELALLALGFDPIVDAALAEQLGLATDDRGAIVVHRHRTSVAGVFAAGDVVSGAGAVASAIASGRKAARQIDEYLSRLPAPSPAAAAAGR